MKYLVYPIALLLIFASCKSEPEIEEVDAERLVGEFIRVKDNGRAGKAHEDSPVVASITFRSKFCNFTYDGTPMSGKYSVDEGYVYIEAGGEIGTLSLEIISANQLEGEGWINGSFMREGFEGEYEHIEGTGNYNGGSAGDNASSTDANNQQSSSSSSDEAGSSNSGSSSSEASNESSSSNNTGTGGNSSGSSTAARHVVQHLDKSNMRGPGSATIALTLTIDEYGDVINTKLDKSRTTTTNQVLVNSVIAAVKKEVKYNKVPGAAYTKVSYLVKL